MTSKPLKTIFLVATTLVLAGCDVTTPKPQKGGMATVAPGTPVPAPLSQNEAKGYISVPSGTENPVMTITQPENPKGSSTQEMKHEAVETLEISVDTVNKTVTEYPDGRKVTVEQPVPAGSKVVKHVSTETKQELGGSWYDNAKEIAAKMVSFRPVQYIGIAILLGALAMFHPAVRIAVGGGKEIQAIAGLVGLGLVFGPAIVVGNEKLILAIGVTLLIGGYLLARATYYKGKVDSSKST